MEPSKCSPFLREQGILCRPGLRFGAGIPSSRLTHQPRVEILQLAKAAAALQSSKAIVNALGWMKIRLPLRESQGLRRPQGLAAVDRAANVEADG